MTLNNELVLASGITIPHLVISRTKQPLFGVSLFNDLPNKCTEFENVPELSAFEHAHHAASRTSAAKTRARLPIAMVTGDVSCHI